MLFKKTYHANISNYNDTFWPCHNVSPESEERTQRAVNTGAGFLTHASITWAAGDAFHVIASLLISNLLSIWALGFSKLPWPVSNMASFLSPTKWSDVIRCDQLDRNYHNYHPTSNSRAAASRISKVDLPCSSGFAANRWRCGDTGSVCTSATATQRDQRGQRGQRNVINVGTLCWASCHPNGPWKAHTVETHVAEGQGDAWRSQAGCWIILDFVK